MQIDIIILFHLSHTAIIILLTTHHSVTYIFTVSVDAKHIIISVTRLYTYINQVEKLNLKTF